MSANFAQLSVILASPLILIAVAALLIAVPVLILLRGQARWMRRIQRKPLLTPNEIEFFHRLQRALPAYQVFRKLRSEPF